MMSISGQPQDFSPVFNSLYFYVDSTNKTNQGFQYICDLYSAGTTDRIARMMTFPRPVDGYGEFGINQILQSEVSFLLEPTQTGSTRNEQSVVNYQAVFGEQYLFEWTYGDYLHSNTIYTGTSYPNSYLLTGSTPHIFSVGDLIQVNPASGSPATLSGVHTVVEVPSPTRVILGTQFVSGPTLSGTVYYADERLTQYTGLTSATTKTAFNGAMNHRDFKDYNMADWILNTGATGSFLTNLPNGYRMRTDSSAFFNLYFSGNTGNTNRVRIITDDGNIGIFNLAFTPAQAPAQLIGLGPYQVNRTHLVSGTQPLITNNTSQYTAYTYHLTPSASTSQPLIIGVEDKCTKFGVFELLFMDKLGSFVSKAFEYQNTRSINITRSEYQKFIGNLSNGRYAYNSIDRGRTSLNTYDITELTLNTGWLTQDEASYLQELFTSPEVYLKIHNDTTSQDEFWPVIVMTNSLEIPKYYNKHNIQYTITVQYGFYNPSQTF